MFVFPTRPLTFYSRTFKDGTSPSPWADQDAIISIMENKKLGKRRNSSRKECERKGKESLLPISKYQKKYSEKRKYIILQYSSQPFNHPHPLNIHLKQSVLVNLSRGTQTIADHNNGSFWSNLAKSRVLWERAPKLKGC